MPNYVEYEFTTSSSAAFIPAYVEYLDALKAYQFGLALVDGKDGTLDELFAEHGLACLAIVGVVGLGSAVFIEGGASAEVVPAYYELKLFTVEEIAAGINAADAGLTSAQLIEKYRYLSFLPPSFLKESITDSIATIANKKFAATLRKQLILKRLALKVAIATEVGNDYQLLQLPVNALITNPTLILGLIPPNYSTDDTTATSATTATLHSTINPKHLTSKAFFTLFPYIGDNPDFGNQVVIPTPSESIGNGVNPIDFSKAVTSLTPETKYGYFINVEQYGYTYLGEIKNFTTPAILHTVTFDGNGNTGGSMEPQTANQVTELSPNGFTKTDFTFGYWGATPEGGVIEGYNEGTYDFHADVTIYVIWSANP